MAKTSAATEAPNLKCPYCGTAFHDKPDLRPAWTFESGLTYATEAQNCPDCGEPIIYLVAGPGEWAGQHLATVQPEQVRRLVCPAVPERHVPSEVPIEIAEDYRDATATLATSPKASAALSRRCLQNTVRQRTNIVERTLEKEIDAVIGQGLVSTGLCEQLHAVRQVGNFAAHPSKDTSTGQIVDVEPGEAEWNLDVLDGLFDELYVAPAKFASRKASLNTKLRAAGKPELT